MECDLHGLRMPELRSGARRSKRLDDLQPPQQPNNQAENLTVPVQNKTRRRAGGGRGRGGNAAGVAKGASPTTRPTGAGRGRGVRLIDLDPEPCQIEPAAVGAAELGYNRLEVVSDKDIAMEGASAEKVIGVEEEGSTTPVPERVIIHLPFFLYGVICVHYKVV